VLWRSSPLVVRSWTLDNPDLALYTRSSMSATCFTHKCLAIQRLREIPLCVFAVQWRVYLSVCPGLRNLISNSPLISVLHSKSYYYHNILSWKSKYQLLFNEQQNVFPLGHTALEVKLVFRLHLSAKLEDACSYAAPICIGTVLNYAQRSICLLCYI